MMVPNYDHSSLRADYPFFWLLPPLAAGILLQHTLPSVPAGFWLLLLLPVAGCCLITNVIRSLNPAVHLIRITSLLLCFLLAGSLLGYHQDVRNKPLWYGNQLKEADALAFKVKAAPEVKRKTKLIPAELSGMHIGGQWVPAAGEVKLYVYLTGHIPDYQTGDMLITGNRLVPVKNSGNPFQFDYAGYCNRNGIYHQAFLNAAEITRLPLKKARHSRLAGIRTSLLKTIHDNVKDSITSAMIEAVTLNERNMLDDELWKAYSVTGIIHIISISGMHVAILFSVILFLLKWIPGKKLEWIKYLLALPLVWTYIAITGFPPSAVRAAVLFTLMAAGVSLNREIRPLNTWCAVAFLLLCYNPYWLFDIGIQLSFLSILSILLFYKPIRNLVLPGNRIARMAWEITAVGIAAQILVFPLVIYYFHQFPLLGLLANIPAALYSFLLMAGSLILLLLGSTGLSCIWIGQALAWASKAFHYIINRLAAWTPSFMQQLYIDSIDYWIIIAAIIFLSIYLARKHASSLIAGLTCSCVLFLNLILQDISALRQDRVVVYNIARQSSVDIIRGKSVSTTFKKGGMQEETKILSHILLPARLGFRAMNLKETTPGIFKTSGKTTLLLQQEIPAACSQLFPVDNLVIGTGCTDQPELWLRTFRPGQVIIDGSISRKTAEKWKNQLETVYGTPVHWVGQDGAWLYPSL
jgi:competence protein ComEC